MRSLSPLLLGCVLSAACQCKTFAEDPPKAPSRPASAVPAAERKPLEYLYDSGLKSGWMDFGWSPRTLDDGAPAKVNLSDYGGWIIAKPGTKTPFGGVTFRYQVPAGAANPFDVRLESSQGGKFPKVIPGPSHVLSTKDGWTEVYIGIEELNPESRSYDKLVFQGRSKAALGEISFDKVAFTEGDPSLASGGGRKAVGPAAEVMMTVDCSGKGQPINPMIYGIAFDPQKVKDTDFWALGTTARRWGGNPTTRYNWQLGNAWNTARDWYFENTNYTENPNYSYELFLQDNLAHKVQTALTVPTIGWVAKDTESVGFPTSLYGKQRATDPYRPHAGDGHDPSGKELDPPSPTQTSIPAPPEYVAKWVRTILEKDAATSRGRSVNMYILDNEPALWHETHRDVHPARVSYDELLDRTIKYGTAVRKADPQAIIAGPAEWGWTNFLYSAVDSKAGTSSRPDRRAHGDLPLIQWYLRKLKEHEKKTGVRVLDVLDLHYYPQGEGMGLGEAGATDAKTAAYRLRATRSLWDPTYKDESWIDDKVRLIPRMKEWISQEYPGLGISIGEYNFGAEHHMSGGLAQAEVLGRFGQHGVTSAFFWAYPVKDSPGFWAFRAYRNYDGQGARFEDFSLPTRTEGATSVFASRDASGKKLVLVALNQDPAKAAQAMFDLTTCGKPVSRRTFQYTGAPTGFTALPVKAGAEQAVKQTLPPYSITVLEISLEPTKAAK